MLLGVHRASVPARRGAFELSGNGPARGGRLWGWSHRRMQRDLLWPRGGFHWQHPVACTAHSKRACPRARRRIKSSLLLRGWMPFIQFLLTQRCIQATSHYSQVGEALADRSAL